MFCFLPTAVLLIFAPTAVAADEPAMTLAMLSCDHLLDSAPVSAPNRHAGTSQPSFVLENTQAGETIPPVLPEQTNISFDTRPGTRTEPDWMHFPVVLRRSAHEFNHPSIWTNFTAGFGRVFFDKPAFRGWQDPPCGFVKVCLRF
jgi:hypothetical protein